MVSGKTAAYPLIALPNPRRGTLQIGVGALAHSSSAAVKGVSFRRFDHFSKWGWRMPSVELNIDIKVFSPAKHPRFTVPQHPFSHAYLRFAHSVKLFLRASITRRGLN